MDGEESGVNLIVDWDIGGLASQWRLMWEEGSVYLLTQGADGEEGLQVTS